MFKNWLQALQILTQLTAVFAGVRGLPVGAEVDVELNPALSHTYKGERYEIVAVTVRRV